MFLKCIFHTGRFGISGLGRFGGGNISGSGTLGRGGISGSGGLGRGGISGLGMGKFYTRICDHARMFVWRHE